MYNDIRHFKSHEFDSPDEPGSGDKMNPEFLHILDKMRSECRFPFIILSGYRTYPHNVLVGGESNSSHLRGLAADILVSGSLDRHALIKAAFNNGITRIGIGSNFVHVDIDYSLPQDVIWVYKGR